MTRKKVKSSNIASIGYDEKKQILEVEFHYKNSVYQYWPFKPSDWKSFSEAKSLGEYHGKYIKGNPKLNYKKV